MCTKRPFKSSSIFIWNIHFGLVWFGLVFCLKSLVTTTLCLTFRNDLWFKSVFGVSLLGFLVKGALTTLRYSNGNFPGSEMSSAMELKMEEISSKLLLILLKMTSCDKN